MAKKVAVDKMLYDRLASGDEQQIVEALEQVESLGWDVPAVIDALMRFLDPLIAGGFLENWSELATPAVPGPRLDWEEATIPLVSVLSRWPAIVPFLPWVAGPRPRFTFFHYVDLFHDLSEEELEEIERRGPIWELIRQTDDWQEAGDILSSADGSVSEQTLALDTFFEEYPHLIDSFRKQTAEAGVFVAGAHVEFEGNHNDAEFTAMVARLVEPAKKKPATKKA